MTIFIYFYYNLTEKCKIKIVERTILFYNFINIVLIMIIIIVIKKQIKIYIYYIDLK